MKKQANNICWLAFLYDKGVHYEKFVPITHNDSLLILLSAYIAIDKIQNNEISTYQRRLFGKLQSLCAISGT